MPTTDGYFQTARKPKSTAASHKAAIAKALWEPTASFTPAPPKAAQKPTRNRVHEHLFEDDEDDFWDNVPV